MSPPSSFPSPCCPDIAEGVLLYVEGDNDGGTRKVIKGAAQNAPDQVARMPW